MIMKAIDLILREDPFYTKTNDFDEDEVLDTFSVKKIMIEFAKYHVKRALQTALEEVPYGGTDPIYYEDVVSILKCYPPENIK